jgi:hypothetical protein
MGTKARYMGGVIMSMGCSGTEIRIHTVLQFFITVVHGVGHGGGEVEGWGKDVNPHRLASHSISQLRVHEETGPIPPH